VLLFSYIFQNAEKYEMEVNNKKILWPSNFERVEYKDCNEEKKE
jgi:hypothetical protein